MARIVDINGNPIERKVLYEPQTSQVSFLHNTFAEHPTQRLTPQRLQHILMEAETGDFSRQADLFTDMEEKDAHLFAEMQKRKRALLTVEHEVIPPPNATPRERADAAWLAEFITELDAWEDFIIDCLDAIGQGFSNIEIDWQQFGYEWYPATFNFRPQSWFQLDRLDQNKILLRTPDGLGEPLQPFGWICHRHKSRSGYIARAGLLRTLSWPYVYRNFGTQSLAELLEIYGIPLRIGKYPEGIGKKEKNELMRAVTELGRYAGGIIPKEMEIALHQAATGSHEPHMALAEWAEKSMSKAILGGTLTTQADGKTSTNALGNIHNEVRQDLLISDGKQLAATIRSDLFYPLLVLNRNAAADPRRTPRLRFKVAGHDQQEQPLSIPAFAKRKIDLPAIIASLKRHQNDPVQTGIDEALTAFLASDQASDSLITILEPALMAASRAGNETELLGLLAETFPLMDETALRSVLGDTLAIARMIGLYDAQRNAR